VKYLAKIAHTLADMVIFRLFKMAAAAIFDFLNFKFLTVRNGQEG